jgi:N-methylhydantoinase B
VIRNDSGHPMIVFCMANRTEFAPLGFAGGHSGRRREHRLNGEPIDGKGRYELAPGDRITLREAGGGGFGDPRERPRERLRRDVANGFVTREAARREYGVDVDAEPVDRDAS